MTEKITQFRRKETPAFLLEVNMLVAAIVAYFLLHPESISFSQDFIGIYQSQAEKLASKLSRSRFVYTLISQNYRWCGGAIYMTFDRRALKYFIEMKISNKYMQKHIDSQDLFIDVLPPQADSKFAQIKLRVRLFSHKNNVFVEAKSSARMIRPHHITCNQMYEYNVPVPKSPPPPKHKNIPPTLTPDYRDI